LGYDIFSHRAEITLAEKLRVAAACAVREPGRSWPAVRTSK
jgi:hypothetical protein